MSEIKSIGSETPAAVAGAAPCSAKHLELIAELSIENRRYKAALERISKWFDEFPPTGRTWDDGTAMSYSAAFGSNGERDYMRQVAAGALSPNDKLSHAAGDRDVTSGKNE